jgi:hypothetical protein
LTHDRAVLLNICSGRRTFGGHFLIKRGFRLKLDLVRRQSDDVDPEAGARERVKVVHPVPLNASRASIQSEADKVRRSLGYKPGDDLAAVVQSLGGRIAYRSFWDALTSEDGSIVIRAPGEFEIFLSDATSPRRDRFTIAHELGHYFLHYPRQRGSIPPGAVMIGRRSATGREETEAHWFAAEFLMPSADFTKAWRESRRSLATVATLFDVSTHAAQVRVRSLGLDPADESRV